MILKCTIFRPIPGREYVEQYIKAYYLPEAQLETWIREHKVSAIDLLFLYLSNISIFSLSVYLTQICTVLLEIWGIAQF